MIVTVTLNPAVDYTLQLEQELSAGSVARTDTTQFDPGGKGINVSKYLVNIDVETVATGFVGGFLGQFLTMSLTEDRIPNDFTQISERTRLNTTILTQSSEYKINQKGPVIDEVPVSRIIETICQYDPAIVLIAGSLPPGIGPEVVDTISDAGPWKTVVDLEGTILNKLKREYLLCKPNREELSDATGHCVESIEDCIAASKALRQNGFDCVVASLGADGAIMVTPDTALHAPALKVDIVDTAGAGDALLAGVLAHHHRDGTSEDMLRTGIAVASRAVTVPGTSVPSLSTISTEIGEINVRSVSDG